MSMNFTSQVSVENQWDSFASAEASAYKIVATIWLKQFEYLLSHYQVRKKDKGWGFILSLSLFLRIENYCLAVLILALLGRTLDSCLTKDCSIQVNSANKHGKEVLCDGIIQFIYFAFYLWKFYQLFFEGVIGNLWRFICTTYLLQDLVCPVCLLGADWEFPQGRCLLWSAEELSLQCGVDGAPWQKLPAVDQHQNILYQSSTQFE
jgi:hypothetical protein